MIGKMQEEIRRLKKENDICILAHCYQSHDIIEVADFVGDSYALAKKAATIENKTVIMCGVRFMAETVKILSPDKKVILSNEGAGCPMAEQMTKKELQKLLDDNKDYCAVAYVNTTAELKTLCEVCVTSASALKIVRNMPQKNIIFIPDINLGSYIKKNVSEKNIMVVQGGCPYHAAVNAHQALEAKKKHPDALLLVHPECKKEVADLADYVGSTTGIMDFAKKSDKKEFIIATENSIVEHMQFDCPEKRFYPVSKHLVCADMKLTTLADVLACCLGKGGEEITLPEGTRIKAKRCIDKMIEYGG